MGLLDAVSVTASNYSSGESVSFLQAMKGLPDWKGPHRKGIRTQLTIEHSMASYAIPVLFPCTLLSLLLFDKDFCGALWRLRYEYVMEQEGRIIEFSAA
jgi:hypothetical protein